MWQSREPETQQHIVLSKIQFFNWFYLFPQRGNNIQKISVCERTCEWERTWNIAALAVKSALDILALARSLYQNFLQFYQCWVLLLRAFCVGCCKRCLMREREKDNVMGLHTLLCLEATFYESVSRTFVTTEKPPRPINNWSKIQRTENWFLLSKWEICCACLSLGSSVCYFNNNHDF